MTAPIPRGIYDNPATRQREAYDCDGKLCWSVSADTIAQKPAPGTVPLQGWGSYPPPPVSRDMTAMVDAAMTEMRNIHPPLRRSECERLIRAALGVGGNDGR